MRLVKIDVGDCKDGFEFGIVFETVAKDDLYKALGPHPPGPLLLLNFQRWFERQAGGIQEDTKCAVGVGFGFTCRDFGA